LQIVLLNYQRSQAKPLDFETSRMLQGDEPHGPSNAE
jgi:hypothetical protein